MKYFTRDENNKFVQIDQDLADDVIKQYIEKRYTWVIGIGMFIIGFLCGVIAYAI